MLFLVLSTSSVNLFVYPIHNPFDRKVNQLIPYPPCPFQAFKNIETIIINEFIFHLYNNSINYYKITP